MDSNNKVEYHIYTKIRGEWFDKRFKSKTAHPTDNFAIDLEVACHLAGKTGCVWLITTESKQIYGK